MRALWRPAGTSIFEKTRERLRRRSDDRPLMRNTFKNSKPILGIATLALAAAALSACVTSPSNDEWVDPNAVDFYGYAEHGGATVDVLALDTQTNQWVPVGSAVASTIGTNYGGETLYAWNALNVDTISLPGQCYWGVGAACSIPAGSASAKFRVREQGGRTFVTFDDGGVECVIDQVESGVNWFTAATSCASDDLPTMTLFALT